MCDRWMNGAVCVERVKRAQTRAKRHTRAVGGFARVPLSAARALAQACLELLRAAAGEAPEPVATAADASALLRDADRAEETPPRAGATDNEGALWWRRGRTLYLLSERV